jgi:V8-like Glu-specific endopeptidase
MIRSGRGTIMLIAGLVIGPSASLAQGPLLEGKVERLDHQVSFLAEAQADVVQWSRREERLGAKYVRLRFSEITDQAPTDYTVLLRDRNGRIVQKFSKEEFKSRTDFWTRIVVGDYVRAEVIAQTKPSGLKFRLSEIAFQQNMGAPFSITLPDDREPVTNYRTVPQLVSRIRSVAKLTFIDGGSSFTCTGFMIDEERMLTNEHCINSQPVCSTAVAIFGYEITETGNVNPGEQYECAQLLGADHKFDVALIRLANKPGTMWGKLQLNNRNLVQGEQAYMVQHPAGEPKQISRKDCSITTVSADGNGQDTDFGHKCDTLGGSSGSPVLGADFTVVGLHHFGFDAAAIRWSGENRAVRMPHIVNWLASR